MITIRAEKTTRNKDDVRVLVAGIFFTIFLIAVKPYVLVWLEPNLSNLCTHIEDPTWWK